MMKNKIKSALLLLALSVPVSIFSQNQNASDTSTVFSNSLFIALLCIIIILLIIILAFSTAFKNVIDSDYFGKKFPSKNNSSNSGKISSIVLIILLAASSLKANDGKGISNSSIGGLDQFTFYSMFAFIILELIILGIMIFQFNFLMKKESVAKKEFSEKLNESKIIKSLTDAVPIEEEESILLDHNYDGIKELDNNLPPWWKYGFYLTIVVAFIYMISYHVIGSGDLQDVEYQKEMAQAKLDVDEYIKKSANNVDENTIVISTNKADIDAGKENFITFCATCHGRNGEGGVGPNMTDEYWLHGGGIKDIFKSIKYGWVEKGMKSWKEELSPIQIAQVSSFIKSIQGTNPAKAKAAQGDLYIEKINLISDSINIVSDSLSIKKDSLETKTKK